MQAQAEWVLVWVGWGHQEWKDDAVTEKYPRRVVEVEVLEVEVVVAVVVVDLVPGSCHCGMIEKIHQWSFESHG